MAISAVVGIMATVAIVFLVVVYRRNVQRAKWLSTDQAVAEFRARFGPDADLSLPTSNVVDPESMHENVVRQ